MVASFLLRGRIGLPSVDHLDGVVEIVAGTNHARSSSWWSGCRAPPGRRLSPPSAFTAGLNAIKGRTKEGESCDCTDPPEKGHGRANNSQVAEKFEKQQRQAAIYNADLALSKPYAEFKAKVGEYEAALKDVKASYGTFKEQMERYHKKYEESDTLHRELCAPFVQSRYGIPVDCEVRRSKEAERFLSRIKHPDCLVGHDVSLDSPEEACMPWDPAAVVTALLATRGVAWCAAPGSADSEGDDASTRRPCADFL